MLSLAVCRCPFRLKRRFFLGMWICLLDSVGLCVYKSCCIQRWLEFIHEVFCSVWSNVYLLIWYVGIILNSPWLHYYKRLDTFNFLFSVILILPLGSDFLVLRAFVDPIYICCLNFWDEACWFLSLRFFGLLSSSLLLFPQRFGWYVLRPSSGVCRTR